jgi:hypothetical protein
MSPRNIRDLSFVSVKAKRRCFWHVRATGDYLSDGRLGERFALEYLAFEEADKGGAGHLQLIVEDMPRKLGPIEISFLTMISYAAGAGADKARRVSAYWDRCRAETGAGKPGRGSHERVERISDSLLPKAW